MKNPFLAATKNIKYTKKEDSPAPPTEAPETFEEKGISRKVSYESEILIKTDHWNKENFPLKSGIQKASGLGKVVCRRWKTKVLLRKFDTKLIKNQIKPFLFDSSSPDDIVRAAQNQSFTRPK